MRNPLSLLLRSPRSVPTDAAQARDSHLESAFWRRALVAGIRGVPLSVQQATMPLWAAFFYAQVPHVRHAILGNLGRLRDSGAAPGLARAGAAGLERLAFRTFRNYCGCVASTYRHYLLPRTAGAPAAREGAEHLDAALAAGRGAILATGHIGHWQLGPHFLSAHGYPPVTVVMAEEPDPATQRMEQALRDRRLRVLYPSRSTMIALELRAALRRGELVAMQVDRPAARRQRVPFLGGEADFAAGPAELALACGAPLVPVFFPVRAEGVVVHLDAPLAAPADDGRAAAVRELTARLARAYGRQVLAHPDQWYNFYSFWSDR